MICVIGLDRTVNVSLVKNSQLIYFNSFPINTEVLNSLYSFLQPFHIKDLKVVVKCYVTENNRISGIKLDTIGNLKAVLSDIDLNAIKSLSKFLGLDSISFYTNFDYYKEIGEDAIYLDTIDKDMLACVLVHDDFIEVQTTDPQNLNKVCKDYFNKYGISKIINATKGLEGNYFLNDKGIGNEKVRKINSYLFSLARKPSFIYTLLEQDEDIDNLDLADL